jgi:sugar phosphate isomerase/epimerase
MFRLLNLKKLGLAATQAEYIELALSYGFRGIDLDLVEFHQRVQTHGLQHARRLFDSAKIKLGTFDLPLDPGADEPIFRQALMDLKPLAETAAAVGCLRALTTVAPSSGQRPYHENFEFHRKRYNDVAAVLAPLGIRLGIGFCALGPVNSDGQFEFIRTFDALVLLVGTIAARNVGIALDLWHLWRSGGKVADVRKLSGQQIVAVDVADAPADQSRETVGLDGRLVPGETGVVELSAALSLLAELGYDGPVTPHIDRSRLGNLGREGVVRRVAEGFDKVWKAAGLSPGGKVAAKR